MPIDLIAESSVYRADFSASAENIQCLSISFFFLQDFERTILLPACHTNMLTRSLRVCVCVLAGLNIESDDGENRREDASAIRLRRRRRQQTTTTTTSSSSISIQ